jgi:uncharacterized membrane protein YedE/YeeE
MDWISKPWPWYIAGPIIGLTVPFLLILGNKPFGISSSMRHICAAVLPSKIPFFNYNWRKESWLLLFTLGVIIGGFIAVHFLGGGGNVDLNPQTVADLQALGITTFDGLLPQDIFNFGSLLNLKGFFFIILGGFLVGFGTRYADGCTSGHSIMGLSNLQWPSLVATVFFMLGGFTMTHLIFPFIFKLF